MKAVTQVNSAIEATARNAQGLNYEKAAAEAINKVKQDLATKEIEQRLKQEIEKQKLNEMLGWSVPVPEAVAGSIESGNCNTLKINSVGKAIRHNKDRSQDNVNNHCGTMK